MDVAPKAISGMDGMGWKYPGGVMLRAPSVLIITLKFNMFFIQITFGWRVNQRWPFLPGFIHHIQDSEVAIFRAIHNLNQKFITGFSYVNQKTQGNKLSLQAKFCQLLQLLNPDFAVHWKLLHPMV